MEFDVAYFIGIISSGIGSGGMGYGGVGCGSIDSAVALYLAGSAVPKLAGCFALHAIAMHQYLNWERLCQW